MYTYDQLNKQPTSAVPLNKRYKYPIADQQALNNQMYQSQQGYMQQGNYTQSTLYQQQQQPYSQLGQQSYSAANPTLAYNQSMMGGYPGQSALQQQAAVAGYGYNQQHYAQASPYQSQLGQTQLSSYAGQAQLPGQTALSNPVGLANQPAVSQAMASNQLNYQTAAAQQQSSAYLPNVQNTLNPSLGGQISTSNPQMPNAAGGYSMAGQYGQQPNMYGQSALAQQQLQQPYNPSLQSQYQQHNY